MGKQKIKDQSVAGAQAEGTSTSAAPKRKRGSRRIVERGRAYVSSSYNNTIVTITDEAGNTLGWASAGGSGFKSSKKATPYAAQRTVENLLLKIKDAGLRQVDVYVNGIGGGREAAVRALQAAGINVISIIDTTPVPHGGVRPKKPRRV